MHVRWYGQSAFLLSDAKRRLSGLPPRRSRSTPAQRCPAGGDRIAGRALRSVEPFVDELEEDVDVIWPDEPEFDATALAGGGAAMSLLIPRAPLA
jgi:hypothetical protein